MDTQKAIELIEKSEHIAIVLPPEADLDLLVSAEVLAKTLEEKNKNVGFLPGGPKLPEKLSSSPLFTKINGAKSLPKEFIVSVDVSRSPVSQLRYERSESFLHIILSPQSHPINKEHISFLDGKVKCDSAIILGTKNIEALTGVIGTGPEFFNETPLINIDNHADNRNFGEANLINLQKASLSEITYEFITVLRGEPIAPDEATLLLAGILSKTDSFRSDNTSADVLLAASEFMRLGAERSTAQSLLSEQSPLGLLRLFGRASVRSKLDEKLGVFWSFVTSDDFEKTGRSPRDLPQILEYLQREAPVKKLNVLLWQDPESKNVSVSLAGHRQELETIRSLTGGAFQSPYFTLEKQFKNFIEAEEYLILLLKGGSQGLGLNFRV